MAWINPETFLVLPHGVAWRPSSMATWAAVCEWCDDRIGEQNHLWAQSGAEMQISNGWWFKHAEHAVLFQLTWC
jgi:hypothetical protein